MKVTILGASGGVGQALSLLLKVRLPIGSHLSLYDIAPSMLGVARDLSHIPTEVKVTGFTGEDPTKALEGANLVLITASAAFTPTSDRSELFTYNASIIKSLVEKIAVTCPTACIGMISNPVNSTVAIAAEVLKKAGVYDKRKLFGVTTLDILRAETFVADLKSKDVSKVKVPVIGGHSGITILPLFSQAYEQVKLQFTDEEIEKLTKSVQDAGVEVVKDKAGTGSATLSMGEAGTRFALAVLKGLASEDIVEYAYVEGDGEYTRFFAQAVSLGRNGIEKVLPLGELSASEKIAFESLIPLLKAEIEVGEKYING
ncbi:malate dehydrogenase [Otariodibacter oris]|uniref:Malate dehydrogenase n=1 Tax=Otariodibacter oris TaxID=1032623 RepID=A0A420XHH1_9PAST|nr:malate dehydrogenase [Otariodibacter oris]QGM81020.1 malate dehydrogenase [Otariodibacter oris]RKR76797.1 malate dehydrogenase (NAD) [Otariodibacter oris]